MSGKPLGWLQILRLGLVQTALGAIVVLMTSTFNRVMVIELALPAIVPGALIGLHYAVQLLRPRWGHGSDLGGRRTPWIIGGMAALAIGAVTAAIATAWIAADRVIGLSLAGLAFGLIGAGVGAAGTSNLVLLAKQVMPHRRAAAATLVWLMMIAGLVLTTAIAGHFLDPFSPQRFVAITAIVALASFVVSTVAVWNVETQSLPESAAPTGAPVPFRRALSEVWQDVEARRLTIFIFVSMLAYSAEELILDPFSGAVFSFSPGESTRLSSLLHGGVLCGMTLVAIAGSVASIRQRLPVRRLMIGGCVGSALALLCLAAIGLWAAGQPLRPGVFGLGVANGIFAVSAIAAMMELAGAGKGAREGVRMGLWGAAQGIAFGLGGAFGAGASDVTRFLVAAPGAAYAAVFIAQAALFVGASLVAARMGRPQAQQMTRPELIRPELARTGEAA